MSIVTPAYNRARFLEQAIQSVLSQDYPNLEHIVMDGASSDGSVDILRSYGGRVRWRSEPDRGQSDALNKALSLAGGEIIGWCNSDDIYLPGAVRQAVEILTADPELDLFYGDCLYIDADGNVIGRHGTKPFSLRRLIWYDSGYFNIQAMFFRRRVIERVGGFDIGLHYALDYDWLIRVGKSCNVRYVPVCLGAFRRHEDATQGKANKAKYFREVTAVSRRHGGNRLTPLKYRILERVPGAPILMGWMRPLKMAMSRVGLVPKWL